MQIRWIIVREQIDGQKTDRVEMVELHCLKWSKCVAGQMLEIEQSTLKHNGDGWRGQGVQPQLMCYALLYKCALVFQRGRAKRQGGQSPHWSRGIETEVRTQSR